MKRKTLIYAHRGASGLVPHENTLEAFQKAIELGADGIELDIRKTLDGIIIINHNPDIAGMMIKDYSYADLEKKTQEIGYHLPTLKETVEFCNGKIYLDIEFKEDGYEQEALDIILGSLKLNEFATRSFNTNALVNIKKCNPDVFTILLQGCSGPKLIDRVGEVFPYKNVKKVNANGVSPNKALVILGYLWRLRRKNVPVSIWTVNEEKDMIKFLKKGAPIIITNYPDKAMELRAKIQK